MNRHHAPAVSHATGRSGRLSFVVCGALLLGTISIGMYFFYASTPQKPLIWQLSLMGLAWCCSAVFAWQFLHRLTQGELDFDGVHWYLGERIGTLSVRFDGQVCMLLRFEDDLDKVDWLWLEARSAIHQDPIHWHDLRRAVYSRAVSIQNTSSSLQVDHV